MLSIEEIKLLKEKMLKLKGTDWDKFLSDQIKILEDLEKTVDANNTYMVKRIGKTIDWYKKDLEYKKENPNVDQWLYRIIQTKIFQFARSHLFNSLEIGPGNGIFSKEFRTWRLNYFLDVDPALENKIRRRFPPAHQKHLKFIITDKTACESVPTGSCNFVFSWDTFVFFTQDHIRQYLTDIHRTLIPGGYCFIQYADCHYDLDLKEAKRKYWAYNTKSSMKDIIESTGIQGDRNEPIPSWSQLRHIPETW